MTGAAEILGRFGIGSEVIAVHVGSTATPGRGEKLTARSPIDGSTLAHLCRAAPEQIDLAVDAAAGAFARFRSIPAPRRGELVRRIGAHLRACKDDLAQLVTLEAGKIPSEALGEVQEMIDVCDFATGLSRQLHGLTMPSERPEHRLMEQWHPLGPVGVITSFNFPVAVWAWNAALALVAGDPVVWKPSEKTLLSALACHAIVQAALGEMPDVPREVASVVLGDGTAGERLASSPGVALVSATGSVRMGRRVAEVVARRLGRSLLELGGNNGAIVAPSADLELALRAVVFAAAGTAGQRCTSLRRLFVHESRVSTFVPRLCAAFASLPVGSPFEPGTLVGPLIDAAAFESMQSALEMARAQGGRVLTGGERVTAGVPPGGHYVRPALVQISPEASIVREETFAPLLYVHSYQTLDEAIALHNAVPQGLSSAIFTMDVREAEQFCSASGSDCGIVNVNTGTSGAEIGGAFGGEKQSGGGRESGSDAWKAYMRRVTTTISHSTDLPLAQGVTFG